MDSYTTIWNNFCKSVTKAQQDNQREMTFEKSTMIDLLSGLGWSRLRNNLVEQKRMTVGHTEVFADFVLLDAESQKEQVVIELKRPKHNQTKEDIEQLWSYMKLSYSPYGLYIGEKIEIYYNRLGDRNEPVSINSINYTTNNKEGIFLLNLLKSDTFDPIRWKEYCEDSIKLMQSVEYWTSEEGKAALFQFILDKAGLSPNFTDRLRTLLTISVERNQYKQSEITLTSLTNKKPLTNNSGRKVSKKKAHKKGKRELYELNGNTYNTKDYAMAIVKALMEENPSYTFQQIKSCFPKSFSWGPIFLTMDEWNSKKQSVKENYFADDILTDIKGQQFVFSNQWSRDGVQKMRECLDKHVPDKVAEERPSDNRVVDNRISREDSHVQVEPTFRMPGKGQTVYSINGGKDFFPASAIGYFIIRRYISEHPNATVKDISSFLPERLYGYKTIIDSKTWKTKYAPGKQKYIRYVNFGFTDGHGKKFYVSNQWDKKMIGNLKPLLNRIGWNVDEMIQG